MERNISFSQRQGIEPINNIVQVDSISDELRNRLWNLLTLYFWEQISSWTDWSVHGLQYRSKEIWELQKSGMVPLLVGLYHDYFKLPIDVLFNTKVNSVIKHIRNYFFQSQYNKVYDFLEFIVNHYSDQGKSEEFCQACNGVLQQEMAGYRFIDGVISPITSDDEISSLTEAINSPALLSPVSNHIKVALQKISDKTNPDFRNSIKESISAVEALCRIITDNPKATLGDALNKLADSGLEIHESLRQSFKNAYGYTSDAAGIRHALMKDSTLNFEDAYYMLISCSAFINYLKTKVVKAGISPLSD
jgi:hypothetical protein